MLRLLRSIFSGLDAIGTILSADSSDINSSTMLTETLSLEGGNSFANCILAFNVFYSHPIYSIPPAIILMILEYGNYTPHVCYSSVEAHVSASDNEDAAYIQVPLKAMMFFQPYRISVEIESKDQGWSSFAEERCN